MLPAGNHFIKAKHTQKTKLPLKIGKRGRGRRRRKGWGEQGEGGPVATSTAVITKYSEHSDDPF